ncbi:MAG TPA: zeta toxin family protein [Verrucomicrobiae bacterium]|nr:zeta toxin family protein [Verrucomicrobiae bacterium]
MNGINELKPQLYIIAGPNGAGKTTFANAYLPRFTKSREFVNADEIAQKLSPANPEAVAIRAGREMLERIRQLASERADFAIETTLSGKSYVSWLQKLKASGYEINLFFLWLPDVQMCIDRVADRVRKGGHNIPATVVRRRYFAGIKNLFGAYRFVLTSWTLFDNSNLVLYTIARERNGSLTVLDEQKLAKFMKISRQTSPDKLEETPDIRESEKAVKAMRSAVAQIVEEHCKTGSPLIIWRDGKVYLQPPEEAKRELEAAIKKGYK